MKWKKMKLLSEINSGFSNILWQVQPGFGELNLVTQQQGLWCVCVCVSVCVCVCLCVCVCEPRRCDFKKSTKAKLRGFEEGSGLTGSLKQLM